MSDPTPIQSTPVEGPNVFAELFPPVDWDAVPADRLVSVVLYSKSGQPLPDDLEVLVMHGAHFLTTTENSQTKAGHHMLESGETVDIEREIRHVRARIETPEEIEAERLRLADMFKGIDWAYSPIGD